MSAIAKPRSEKADDEMAKMLDTEESTDLLFSDPTMRARVWEMAAHRFLYVDSAAALVLICATEIERFHRNVGLDLFPRGDVTYINSITFSRAVNVLANQYKHQAKWSRTGEIPCDIKGDLENLVEDPMRNDACAVFLQRGYAEYDSFEGALLSCSEGIVTDGSLPLKPSRPKITIRPPQ